MEKLQLFNILDSVDSTNNYAMGQINAGMAVHGMAWFAKEQTAGKGQRGRRWKSEPNNNLILSVILKPTKVFVSNPFYLSALVAVTCHDFLQKITGETFFIKWPNDLYWGDRKTGGILIENKFSAENWNWSVVGIGINVNQTLFENELANASSLKLITGKEHYEPIKLAREMHEYLMEKIDAFTESNFEYVLAAYNKNLYKINRRVKFKKENAVFSSCIKEVNAFGQLLTNDSFERVFDFGEVQWIVEDE